MGAAATESVRKLIQRFDQRITELEQPRMLRNVRNYPEIHEGPSVSGIRVLAALCVEPPNYHRRAAMPGFLERLREEVGSPAPFDSRAAQERRPEGQQAEEEP
ncbi:unnamed protein product [Durusdinium trenchii]|uniref:Uncharacterized protein n=1 Tax=Durusdinium trenchii TaxID=1381693 RepID=A0ABP0S2Y9_9DINO